MAISPFKHSIQLVKSFVAAAVLLAIGYMIGHAERSVPNAHAEIASPASTAPASVTIIRGSRIEERPTILRR